MDIYDIHTYTLLSEDSDEPYHPYIFNTSPLGFEDAVWSNKQCFFSCGIHPWYSEDATPQMKFLEEVSSHPRIVAIGECGMDKLKGPEQDIQKKIFEQHIHLSEKLKKPLIIHCVKAWETLVALKKQHKPTQAWIIHGFRGKPEMTRQLVQLGFRFSIGMKFNKKSLPHIPLERMFCETDDDDVPISEVYLSIAQELQLDLENFTSAIKKNVEEVFPQIVQQPSF